MVLQASISHSKDDGEKYFDVRALVLFDIVVEIESLRTILMKKTLSDIDSYYTL